MATAQLGSSAESNNGIVTDFGHLPPVAELAPIRIGHSRRFAGLLDGHCARSEKGRSRRFWTWKGVGEGEELRSNVLHVAQRKPASSRVGPTVAVSPLHRFIRAGQRCTLQETSSCRGVTRLRSGRDADCSRAPRTEPYERLSRIRLPPRVVTAFACRMRSSACDTLTRL
jgi:hypothetical protein